jgi:hypothetical protein
MENSMEIYCNYLAVQVDNISETLKNNTIVYSGPCFRAKSNFKDVYEEF